MASNWFQPNCSRLTWMLGLCVSICVASGALAQTDTLTVSWLQGEVSYRYDSQQGWTQLGATTTLQLPVEVRTRSDSGLTLSQGESTFSIRENSHVELSNSGMRSVKLVDRVLQLIGTVIYQVESSGDDFVVETPFLAATVKGTRFVVVASEENSLVSLQEGTLEVVDFNSGDTEMMLPGDVVGANAVAANAPNNANPNAGNNANAANNAPGLARVQNGGGRGVANNNGNGVGLGPQQNGVAAAARQQRNLDPGQRRNFGQQVSDSAGFQGITTAIEAKQQRDNRGRGRGQGNGNGNGN